VATDDDGNDVSIVVSAAMMAAIGRVLDVGTFEALLMVTETLVVLRQ
jgi:hypothetical protein